MDNMHVHTSRVTRLRLVLPILAVLVLIGVVIYPTFREIRADQQSRHSATRLKVEQLAVAMPKDGAPLQLQVTRPQYTGQDDKGQPYVITATKVIQDGMDPHVSKMHLQSPTANLLLNEATNEHLHATAITGLYDPQAKTLQLAGPVVVTHSDGFQLNMQESLLDLDAGSAISTHPVTGFGPGGTMEGESLELLDQGNTIILHGKSKVTLIPQETPKDPTP
jgi:lipopolysaccharide export system protein LptC